MDENTPLNSQAWHVADIVKTGLLFWAIIIITTVSVVYLMLTKIHTVSDIEWTGQLAAIIAFCELMGLLGLLLALYLVRRTVVKKYHNNFFSALGIDSLSIGIFLRFAFLGILIAAFFEVCMPLAFMGSESSSLIFMGVGLKIHPLVAVISTTWILMTSFVSEIVYRGYVYLGIKSRYSTLEAAIATTILAMIANGAFLFILWPLGVAFFTLAAILMIIRVKTGSLTRCIAVHGGFNLTFLVFSLIYSLTQEF